MGDLKFTMFDLIRDPYPVYREMRKSGPIHWNEEYHCWCIIDYDVSREFFKEEHLSADLTLHLKRTVYPEKIRNTIDPLLDLCKAWLLFSDPPYHTVSRKLLAPFFGPAALDALMPKIEVEAMRLLDACSGEWDLVNQFSLPLMLFVLSEIMGFPKEDGPSLFRWGEVLVDFSASLIRTSDVIDPALEAMEQEEKYLKALIKKAVASDNPSFIKTVYQGMQEMECDVDDLWKWMSFLLIAGAGTTRDFISNGMLALLRNPSQLSLLQEKPELLSLALEELLRFDAPGQSAFRTATQDIEISGVTIKKGDQIRIFFGAINRNPKDFKNPDTLDITRSPNKHISFGAGVHFCIGNVLARAISRFVFSEIIKRFPNLTLVTKDPERINIVGLRGVKSLIVK